MKRVNKKEANRLYDEIKGFIKELPDPEQCQQSTIQQGILVNNRNVTLMAQKKKGAEGMCWSLDYNLDLVS